MDMVQIREAKREDCLAIRNLIQELADYEKMPNEPKIDYKILERDGFDMKNPLFFCYVATIDQQIIGYALAYYTYSTWHGKIMFLEDLYVTSNQRRKHVGTKLFKTIAKKAKDTGCYRLDFTVLQWNPAQEFYKSLGAIDVTEKTGWHVYRLMGSALETLATN
ncbi:PREDICTED: diamine acetyltransferase 2 [Polistes dominula]|uniref:Diamine acetyltransferase 2 n=1 Tax=Polistes dominula TaxID=743375 RepID=A0ABM1J9F4_POLDO|nr:PREDICTED: diamine acetyltransferase 2 [Polistes dominula]